MPTETAPAADAGSGETTTPADDKYTKQYERQKLVLQSRRDAVAAQLERTRLDDEVNSAAWRQVRGEDPPPGTFASSDKAARTMRELDAKLALLRPSSAEDIAYRLRVQDRLRPAMVATVPDGLPLRFHGTDLTRARDIIHDHGISSSVDRLNYATSFDAAGQISVTAAEDLDTSLGSYTGLNDENYCVPPGCLFVMMPASPEDAESGKTSMIMGNVDFVEQAPQLVGILTAPENIPSVQQWVAAEGIDPAKVQEFFAFTDQLEGIKESVAAGETALQDYVPYPLPEALKR